MKARIPNGGGGMSQANMMKQLQKMQDDAARVQAEIEETEFTGVGGGVVEVTVTGGHQVTGIHIQPEAIDPEDTEMLEDFLMVAFNDAIAKATTTMEEELGKVTGNMNIPGVPGMGL